MGTIRSKKKCEQGTTTPEDAQEIAEETLASVFACSQDGYVKVFQRPSSLEKHLSLEQCVKYLEKCTLLDLAKLGYKSRLEEDVGSISIPASATMPKKTANVSLEEGWALKRTKKSYRFNDKQKSYLEATFAIGQSTGKKLDEEVVSREMRRALGTDGVRLFKMTEFLTAMQISSYFSRLAATPVNRFLKTLTFKPATRKTTSLKQESLLWPLPSNIPSPMINMMFAPWPRMDHSND